MFCRSVRRDPPLSFRYYAKKKKKKKKKKRNIFYAKCGQVYDFLHHK